MGYRPSIPPRPYLSHPQIHRGREFMSNFLTAFVIPEWASRPELYRESPELHELWCEACLEVAELLGEDDPHRPPGALWVGSPAAEGVTIKRVTQEASNG